MRYWYSKRPSDIILPYPHFDMIRRPPVPKGDKYADLTRYLSTSHEDKITMTFDQVADIVGSLPVSAYKYPAFWSNSDQSSSFSFGWQHAGYSTKVDIKNKWVTFYKSNTSKPQRVNDEKNFNDEPHAIPTSSRKPKLDIEMAINAIEKFYKTTDNKKHTRYRSWVHCHNAFHKLHHLPNQREYLCLHLAWYLASWGMLRNSFLLAHDYYVHWNVVNQLCADEFTPLFEHPERPQLDLVLKAADTIAKSYPAQKTTDTLKTKILLVVFGCTPAYDRYFRYSASTYKVCSQNFNRRSLEALWRYYNDNKQKFDTLQKMFTNEGISYPPMKLMDMAMWQMGYDSEN